MLKRFISILFIIFSVIPSLTNCFYGFSKFIYMVFAYLIGAFIKKYSKFFNVKHIKLKIIGIIAFLVVFSFFLNYLDNDISRFSNYFMGISKFPLIILSIYVYIFFEKKEFKSKLVNNFAKCSLGVYLISDNIYMRQLLWKFLFNIRIFNNGLYFVLYITISVIIVYIGSVIIDYIRIVIFDKIIHLKKLINYLLTKLAIGDVFVDEENKSI